MKHLYLILLLGVSPLITAQNVNIPYPDFKNCLLYRICADLNDDGILDSDVDTNDDGEIQVSEALAVKNLNTLGAHLTSVAGINAFTNLKSLVCINGGLSSLTISGLENLQSIDCSANSLYGIYLTGLSQLQTLNCSVNPILSALNFSGLDNLKTLNCSGSSLINLDVSNMPALETLDISGNYMNPGSIATLTVSSTNAIKDLNCMRNISLTLNLSDFPNLKSLNYSHCAIASIDFSVLNQLENLDCSYNNLSLLDTSNLTNLKELSCTGNNLTMLNLNNPNLEILNCAYNNISSLDTSTLTNLKTLDCSINNLSTLDVNNLTFLETLNCSKNILTILDVSNLALLKDLNCAENDIATLPVANLIQLQTLNCMKNNLSELNLSGLSNLEVLDCSTNNLTALDASNSNNLKSLNCNTNQITTIDATGANNLETLKCRSNALTALDITPFVNLEVLSCGYNQISTMNFINFPALWSIELASNLFTTLDFSQLGSVGHSNSYRVENNANLAYLNIKNGAPIRRQASYQQPPFFSIQDCNNLQYVCVDEFNLDRVYSPTAEVNTYCSFNPGGIYNTITGTYILDYDNNGCDENDSHLTNHRINIDDGTVNGATYANETGNYTFYTQAGDFTITPVFDNEYFIVSPASATVNFESVDGSIQTHNFCVSPNGIHNDVEITVIPLETPRPGFDFPCQLIYKNKGNQTLSGEINLTFDDAILDFVSANPALSNLSTNTLNWTYENLSPFDGGVINFILNVNSPQETPAVNIGDILSLSATIDPVAGDSAADDNTFALRETVVGSFDPNDKTCLEGTSITIDRVGDYLHYVIRFENTGSAAAENIIVRDMIDNEKFDIGSFELTTSSHPHLTRIIADKVEFIFEGINLPAAIDDEAGSHGYIAFKIKSINSLVTGDAIANTADIYFDYNYPVVTNTATTTVTSLLANKDFENKSVSIYPNPTKDKLHITAKSNITSVKIFDLQGRYIKSLSANSEQVTIDIATLMTGIYLLEIKTNHGISIEKIVKE